MLPFCIIDLTGTQALPRLVHRRNASIRTVQPHSLRHLLFQSARSSSHHQHRGHHLRRRLFPRHCQIHRYLGSMRRLYPYAYPDYRGCDHEGRVYQRTDVCGRQYLLLGWPYRHGVCNQHYSGRHHVASKSRPDVRHQWNTAHRYYFRRPKDCGALLQVRQLPLGIWRVHNHRGCFLHPGHRHLLHKQAQSGQARQVPREDQWRPYALGVYEVLFRRI